ncbi:MAG: phosphoribosylglycinamide formyltransferase [Phycisphaerae bacterium]
MSDNNSDRKPLRLGVLLSGGGTTLLNLLDRKKAGRLDIEVAVVIGSRPCKGIDRAADAGLETHVVPYKMYRENKDPDGYSAEITRTLETFDVDLVILAGFLSLWKIPPRYQGKVMNIHPALLPAFGGKGMYGHHVHEAVVAHGCKVSGCTVHFVTNEYDAGPIIAQRTVPVYDTDSPDDVADRVFEQECIAYPEAIQLYMDGRLRVDGRIVRIAPE